MENRIEKFMLLTEFSAETSNNLIGDYLIDYFKKKGKMISFKQIGIIDFGKKRFLMQHCKKCLEFHELCEVSLSLPIKFR